MQKVLSCSSCVHAVTLGKLEGGGMQCRLNPPTVFPIGGQAGITQTMSFFPPVNEHMFCSNYDEGNEEENETANQPD